MSLCRAVSRRSIVRAVARLCRAHRHGVVRIVPDSVGAVGLAEKGSRGHHADAVSVASAVVQLSQVFS